MLPGWKPKTLGSEWERTRKLAGLQGPTPMNRRVARAVEPIAGIMEQQRIANEERRENFLRMKAQRNASRQVAPLPQTAPRGPIRNVSSNNFARLMGWPTVSSKGGRSRKNRSRKNRSRRRR